MVTQEEDTLIAQSRKGDLDAFAALICLHQPMIYSLAYRMSGSDADAQDLAQETFIRAFHGLNSYRGSAKFSSWLYRIALNLCLRWKKHEQRREWMNDEWARREVRAEASDPASERVREALAALSPKQRAAVVLTVYDGLTHAEAAGLLGCRESTLSWRLFAARTRLARLLREEGNGR